MAEYIQTGNVLNYRNDGEEEILPGEVVVLTNRVGVAACHIPVGGLGAVAVSGVYEMPAETTGAFTVGQPLYWDAENGILTASSGVTPPSDPEGSQLSVQSAQEGNPVAGWAAEPKEASSSAARVRLGGL